MKSDDGLIWFRVARADADPHRRFGVQGSVSAR